MVWLCSCGYPTLQIPCDSLRADWIKTIQDPTFTSGSSWIPMAEKIFKWTITATLGPWQAGDKTVQQVWSDPVEELIQPSNCNSTERDITHYLS